MRTLLLDGMLLLIGCSLWDRSFAFVPCCSQIQTTTTTTCNRSLPFPSKKQQPHLQAILDPSLLSSAHIMADGVLNIDKDTAEALAGPFFGISLLPYLCFLYFLNVPENNTPKGVVVGFAACLLFVFLTIPAAIAAKLWYDVSLADCDWLHGSAESLLTITNLATVLPFRQALAAKKKKNTALPANAADYGPTLVAAGTVVALATALLPAVGADTTVHTPYLNGCLDLPASSIDVFGGQYAPEPDNALTVATWIIHVSSLVEFLVAMGFCWRWGDVVRNPTWKGLTWGLLPLHSSGITACVSHLFYNRLPFLVPLQALLTCVGNSTAAYAAYRIAKSNGWKPSESWAFLVEWIPVGTVPLNSNDDDENKETTRQESQSLVGFEDLGDALEDDNDYTFLIKLFAGCALFSYLVKYGETFFSFPYDANIYLALAFIGVPSALNAYKWNRRSKDPSFEGWF